MNDTTMGRLLLTIMALIALAGSALAQERAPEWKRVSLLADRLSLRVPAGARVVGMSHGLMSAQMPEEVEVRVFADIGPKKLVVVATELFQRADAASAAVGKHFADQMRKSLGVPELRVSLREIRNRQSIAVLEPATPWRISDAYLVRAAIVSHKDATLLQVRFFVGAADQASSEDILAATDRILESVEYGSRSLRSGAGVQLAYSATFDLPAGYTAYVQPGPDFKVYWAVKISRYDEQPSRLGIYVGRHPRGRSAPAAAQQMAGKALGENVTWFIWDDAGTAARGEAYLGDPGPGLSTHLFVRAADSASRRELLRIAENARLN